MCQHLDVFTKRWWTVVLLLIGISGLAHIAFGQDVTASEATEAVQPEQVMPPSPTDTPLPSAPMPTDTPPPPSPMPTDTPVLPSPSPMPTDTTPPPSLTVLPTEEAAVPVDSGITTDSLSPPPTDSPVPSLAATTDSPMLSLTAVMGSPTPDIAATSDVGDIVEQVRTVVTDVTVEVTEDAATVEIVLTTEVTPAELASPEQTLVIAPMPTEIVAAPNVAHISGTIDLALLPQTTLTIIGEGSQDIAVQADGSFAFDRPYGSYHLLVTTSDYLPFVLDITADSPSVDLPPITLADFGEQNTPTPTPNIQSVIEHFGQTVPPAPISADVNGDHVVDIYDLVIVSRPDG